MTAAALLADAEIADLLAGRPITALAPWAGADFDAIDAHLAQACAALEQALEASSRIVWDDYGSGYASFVDAWFTLAPPQASSGTGLVVLFSRLSPCYVFMEGDKTWSADGGSSYLPCFEMVDRMAAPDVVRMAAAAQNLLERRGFVRARRAALAAPLRPGLEVPTILASGPLTQFDALFHWED